MIIYSVTVSIEKRIESEWLGWMVAKHIPDVLQSGYFSHHYITEVIEPVVEESMSTFNIQYHCETMELLNEYQEKAAPDLQKEHFEEFKDKFVAFRSILRKV